jgi:hypothetical protein
LYDIRSSSFSIKTDLFLTVRNLIRSVKVRTDIRLSLGILGDVNVTERETRTGSTRRTGDTDDRQVLGRSRTRAKSVNIPLTIIMLSIYLPSDIIDNDVADAQGLGIVLFTVSHLVLVTIVSSDDDRVFSIDELDMFKTNIGNGTFTYRYPNVL